MRIVCIACEGTGIGTGTRANFGELMNLCDRCDGLRTIDTERKNPPFVAIWPVSERYAVYMQVPRRKGGYVELDIEWQPRLPPERGKGKLTAAEKRAYARGRNQALNILMQQLGGGDFSVLGASDRH